MVEFFQSIADFFASIGQFIVSSIRWTGRLFTFVASAVSATVELLSYVPVELAALAIIVIVCAVIFLILGR